MTIEQGGVRLSFCHDCLTFGIRCSGGRCRCLRGDNATMHYLAVHVETHFRRLEIHWITARSRPILQITTLLMTVRWRPNRK